MSRTVLVVDDEANMLAVMRMVLEDAGHQVECVGSAEAALPLLQNPNLDVVVTDLRMPGLGGEELVKRCRQERPDVPVIIVTAHGTIRSAVASIHAGAANYLTKPFEPEEMEIAVHNALQLRDVLRENQSLKATVTQYLAGRRLLGNGPAARRLGEDIQRVAPYKTSVLITGESGTGKELVARTLHELSPRHAGAWVAINCSAIPRDLMESELFGYVKGAFTGASQNRLGRLEQAQGGTLFLDEIGELDPAMQAKLLRVLQEREYSPVGSNQVRAIDVRFIAATNRDLRALVKEKRFREDLLYRLDVYSIVVPALRERAEDVPLLAETFLREMGLELGKSVAGIAPPAIELLARYPWPGNIRELRNAIERAVLTCRGGQIEARDLLGALNNAPMAPAPKAGSGAVGEGPVRGDRVLDEWLEEVERAAILEALAQSGGVQAQAARRLGIAERSLWHRIKKLRIQVTRSFT